jgi:hypothetical protein
MKPAGLVDLDSTVVLAHLLAEDRRNYERRVCCRLKLASLLRLSVAISVGAARRTAWRRRRSLGVKQRPP